MSEFSGSLEQPRPAGRRGTGLVPRSDGASRRRAIRRAPRERLDAVPRVRDSSVVPEHARAAVQRPHAAAALVGAQVAAFIQSLEVGLAPVEHLQVGDLAAPIQNAILDFGGTRRERLRFSPGCLDRDQGGGGGSEKRRSEAHSSVEGKLKNERLRRMVGVPCYGRGDPLVVLLHCVYAYETRVFVRQSTTVSGSLHSI